MRIRSTLGKGTMVVVRLPLMPQCPLPKEDAGGRNRRSATVRYGALPKIRTKLAPHLGLRLDQASH